MGFEIGKVGVFKVTDSGAVQRDLTAYLTDLAFPRDVGTVETTVFGNADRTFLATLRGGTIDIGGHWDGGAAPAPDVVLSGDLGLATPPTFECGPQGSTTGKVKYTGSCNLTRYGMTQRVDGSVDFTASFQITGLVTRGTYA